MNPIIVFSTYVEGRGILHVCGGDPGAEKFTQVLNGYSPRMWR